MAAMPGDTLTAEQRALWGRVGAAVARSRHDPRELTSNARAAFLARFEREIREQYPDLPEPEIQRRAAELRRARMLALAARSSMARSKKRAAPNANGTAQESNGALPPTDRRPAA
jgi:hypothetical protein